MSKNNCEGTCGSCFGSACCNDEHKVLNRDAALMAANELLKIANINEKEAAFNNECQAAVKALATMRDELLAQNFSEEFAEAFIMNVALKNM